MPNPEADARLKIDADLEKAGWKVQDSSSANIHAGRGVALREFPLKQGHGFADYLLYVNGKAAGVVEAKKVGTTLTGVEIQSARYSEGLPDALPAHQRPLPFLYQSTSAETRFTNWLDPEPRSRRVFNFHRPETLAGWLAEYPSTFRKRLRDMPPLVETGLRKAQFRAVGNLERSFAEDRPRALIQMATGSGKTIAAIAAIYRLIKFADAPRILFLVDRGNLGKQALDEFAGFTPPDDNRKFTELYNVQHLTSNTIDPVARVCISTIQRLYSILRGDPEMDPTLEQGSQFDTLADLIREPVPVEYKGDHPIERFGLIVVDECHRSIYTLWRQVIEYYDAFIVGLTATPAKQTFGFFNQNLVMEYKHLDAVADGDNVPGREYVIRTEITEQGATVEAGYYIDRRDRQTRAVRWEQLDEDLTYEATELDRKVTTPDQIRTIIRTFRDRLFTEMFPDRTVVPKTLIYAKDDSHADDIVQVVREEFGKGNDFCQKITYKTGTARVVTREVGPDGQEVERVTYKSSGIKPEQRLSDFRNSHDPRIAITVDMIATGTDIKPLEIVMFMRSVKSKNYFEQMEGRGVRTISPVALQSVTPDATLKDHFVIVDCVGQLKRTLTDITPIERKPGIALDSLLNTVGFGGIDADVLSSIASRLLRLDKQLGPQDREELARVAPGQTLGSIAAGLLSSLDPDRHVEAAREAEGLPPDAIPNPEQIARASERLRQQAAAPLASNATLRSHLVEIRQRFEQAIDTVSRDTLISAGFVTDARERAGQLVASFEKYIREHKDEIDALQILYSQPHARRLRLADVKALAAAIRTPLRLPGDDPDGSLGPLWRAYQTLEQAKVRGAGGHRLWTDIVSLVRYATHQADELAPFPETVAARFDAWLSDQEAEGRTFTAEQREWLGLIRDHIAANLAIDLDDFDMVPFNQRGGLGKVDSLFGEGLAPLLDELNEVLAA